MLWNAGSNKMYMECHLSDILTEGKWGCLAEKSDGEQEYN